MTRHGGRQGDQVGAAHARGAHGHQAEGGSRKRKRGAWFVVFVIALVVFVAALAALGAIAFSYFQGQQKYGQVAETASLETADLESDYRAATVDWDALLAANPDTVGWVYIPGTAVNYPVVQGADNEHYLTHDFDGDAGWLANYGAVFLDYRNARDWSDQVNFVYGHHMNDGSMFADIAGMRDQARFDVCRTVYLLTPQGNYRLRTFALVHCSAYDPIVETTFADGATLAAYLQDKADRSVTAVNDAPAVADMKRAFAFATCDDYSDGRYVLFAYVESSTVSELGGEVGIATDAEGNTGFADGLTVNDRP